MSLTTLLTLLILMEPSLKQRLTLPDGAQPADILTIAEGFYLLEYGEKVVLKLDKQGKVVRKIGNQGSGPGEFRFPTAIHQHQDTLIVFDAMGGKLNFFDANGVFVRDIRLERGSSANFFRDRVMLYFPLQDKLFKEFTLEGDIERMVGDRQVGLSQTDIIMNHKVFSLSDQGVVYINKDGEGFFAEGKTRAADALKYDFRSFLGKVKVTEVAGRKQISDNGGIRSIAQVGNTIVVLANNGQQNNESHVLAFDKSTGLLNGKWTSVDSYIKLVLHDGTMFLLNKDEGVVDLMGMDWIRKTR